MKKLLLGSALAAASFTSTATIVEMNTSQGVIEINLFDQQTPKTVANFLSYVQDDSYNETVIHRSVSNFVIQGGGFTFSDSLDAITTKPAVENEPVFSNVKGTIAMAKLSGDANSATSQWFFNITDNSAALDTQNGGFTVFGQITGASQSTLDKIAALVHCGETPVVDITAEQCASTDVTISSANLVTIQNVAVMDDDPNSAAGLTVTENTLIDSDTSTGSSSSSGGGLIWLLGAFLLAVPRLKRAK
ncbi:peptidylprolyl isomerase [Pseudoalteromonas sp. SR43-6]|uniref:peptidylprolyl isomerase n=1 Tax=unclassified Pseudoalteromonas TaxID=194690 RepID=UPI0015FD57A5|nr:MULTISPECIES: peptidylprolyl isomerase [unclassified Pseudoalteromonas]MBB1288326.1 peptidylprolyl isomerase [Pseudoalteromonas sp. SR41-5]MBB1374463.1 peptidylprolyl isomerase [Pseudoalteromonas sp. SR43-6]MBB1413339.1 peptidylprolyl isomerase [Pseudoalteromonas sp. SG43-8]